MSETKNIAKELAANINALRAAGGYLNAGIPNYNHLFGRDSCVSALQLLDFDPEIAKSTLETMARYQAKKRGLMNEASPGKMLHEHYPGGLKQMLETLLADNDKLRKIYSYLFWRFPYYGTIDAGAWFIILMHRYYKQTGDEAYLRTMWPVALGVVKWLETRAANRPSGLVMYKKEYILGLKSQSWKDTLDSHIEPPLAVIEVQGYYFEAYNCLAQLSEEVFNDNAGAERFSRKAETLKHSFNDFFWQNDKNYVSLAANEAGERDETIASNPGHLLFTGILSEAQAAHVKNRLTTDDMWTPYGVRTLSTREALFDANSYQQGSVWPFDNWVIYQGMLKSGFTSEAEKIKEGLLAAYETLGEIPELYSVSKDSELARYPEACRVQAWSAGGLLNMLTQTKPIL